MWSASHGLARNCTRWVTSCRHTQARKSAGITRNWRSTPITFGYTSRSSPPFDGRNGSYWPRMPCDTNASTAPVCAPVIRPLMKPFLFADLSPATGHHAHRLRGGADPLRAVHDAGLGNRPALDEAGDLTHRHLGVFRDDSASCSDDLPAGVIGGRGGRAAPAYSPTAAANFQSTARPTPRASFGVGAHSALHPHEAKHGGEGVERDPARRTGVIGDQSKRQHPSTGVGDDARQASW